MQVFLSFVYMCIAVGDPVVKRGGFGKPINLFSPATFVCLPSQDLVFQHVMVFFVFNELRRWVIVLFVDMGGKVVHHSL